MKINLIDLAVGDLVEGYSDDSEGSMIGYGNKLDIRPPFQRGKSLKYGTVVVA